MELRNKGRSGFIITIEMNDRVGRIIPPCFFDCRYLVLLGRLETVSSEGMGILLYCACITTVADTLWASFFALLLKKTDSLGVICFIALIMVISGIYIVNKSKNN